MAPLHPSRERVRSLGGVASNPQRERRLLGWFSLLLGLTLCGLILVRAQQAARDGNRELQRDTTWVLVSPAVFSVVGLLLLRSSRRRQGGQAGPRLRYDHGPSLRPEATATLAAARQGVNQASHRSDEALARLQQAQDTTERQLLEARSEAMAARAAAEASRQELERVSAEAGQTVAALQQQLHEAEQQRLLAERQLRELPIDSADLTEAERNQHRMKELVGGLSRELQEARSSLDRIASEDLPAVTAASSRAAEAVEAAQAACRDVTALRERQAQRLEEVRGLLERCSAVEHGELAGMRRAMESLLEQVRATQAATAQLTTAATERLTTLEQAMQQAQQASRGVVQDLGRALQTAEERRQQSDSRAEACGRRVEELAAEVKAELQQAWDQSLAARRSSQDARQLVDRLEQVVYAIPAAAPAVESSPMGAPEPSPVADDPAYREACEELGVLPGSSWQQVRAAWRRNLLSWHPDQGGDPRLWSRRQAAYQLLEAWYAFHAAP